MKKYDVVYPIGSGSQWNNSELRYSLRAIEQNLKGVRNIVIVGRCPDFIDTTKVIHIPAEDPLGGGNADGNIALKVLKACVDQRVSDDFLFINDDHIINKRMHIDDIGFYHKGNFADFGEDFWTDGLHRQRLLRTFEILKEKGHSTFHFDLHTPITINKQKFSQTVPKFNFHEDIGYTMKSIYANPVVPDDKKEFIGDRKTKIFHFKKLDRLMEIFEQAQFISYNDHGLNGELKYFLSTYFPEISQYEKYDKEQEPSVEIREYLAQDNPDYFEGVELFRKHGKNSNLLFLFQRRQNEHTREKLLFKLDHIASRF